MGTEASKEEIAAARGYEELFVPALFEPWTRHVVKGLVPSTRSRVLDVACGTGVLARDIMKSTSGLEQAV